MYIYICTCPSPTCGPDGYFRVDLIDTVTCSHKQAVQTSSALHFTGPGVKMMRGIEVYMHTWRGKYQPDAEYMYLRYLRKRKEKKKYQTVIRTSPGHRTLH